MSVNVAWDNMERSIFRLDFETGWTVPMLDDALRFGWNMIGKSGHKVDLVFNLCEQRQLPDAAVSHVEQMLAIAPATLGFIVIAARSEQVENAFTVLARVDPRLAQRLVFVPTIEGARSALSHPYTLTNRVSPAQLGKS